MFHIDIRHKRPFADGVTVDTADVIVEVSNDGAPWKLLATFPRTVGMPDKRSELACAFVQAWMNGARYAGAEVRATAFGYAL